MGYAYDELSKVLDPEVPLVTREVLLMTCKEIDEDTPESETAMFIADAHIVVCANLDGWGIPLSLLSLIEKQLSAHFAVLAYPSTSREALGPMSRSYLLKAGDGYASTRYGQSAVSLDPTGVLKKLSDGTGIRAPAMHSLGSGLSDAELAASAI